MKHEKDNQLLRSLIGDLLKTEKPLWIKVAYELSKPRRKRIEVNLSKIDAFANDDETILVPGKVLGSGNVSKKVTVAAFSFSESAKQLISMAGGKAMTIESLRKTNPEGKGVTIIK
ncbi:50S ribosomal protein L18e [Candidatus Bilamarchaeum dharawalense]|uniref:Large ribosomal subunit protein eL18 n=1 Tax=Candidatus Bilamarchaeum dharawalense TaxID=2885759 RepID=A0A5E4LMU4_9ARCH|nr:50S ribosomal protein L18e [Candidatus Bilamarchaeum dharawalense]